MDQLPPDHSGVHMASPTLIVRKLTLTILYACTWVFCSECMWGKVLSLSSLGRVFSAKAVGWSRDLWSPPVKSPFVPKAARLRPASVTHPDVLSPSAFHSRSLWHPKKNLKFYIYRCSCTELWSGTGFEECTVSHAYPSVIENHLCKPLSPFHLFNSSSFPTPTPGTSALSTFSDIQWWTYGVLVVFCNGFLH